jgi:hypothetical protein
MPTLTEVETSKAIAPADWACFAFVTASHPPLFFSIFFHIAKFSPSLTTTTFPFRLAAFVGSEHPSTGSITVISIFSSGTFRTLGTLIFLEKSRGGAGFLRTHVSLCVSKINYFVLHAFLIVCIYVTD